MKRTPAPSAVMRVTDARIQLLTFRDGLLGRLGHDLRLSVHRFEVAVDKHTVSAELSAESLELDGAIVGGRLRPSELSARDRRDILRNAAKVLKVDRYPQIRFRGQIAGQNPDQSGTQLAVSGDLELAGRSASTCFDLIPDHGRLKGRVSLTPTRWGIAPFKALLGALRLQDRVEVLVDVADPRGAG